MNRRSFFTKLGLAATSIAILPSAITYARNWVSPPARFKYLINPEWVNAPYEFSTIWHPGQYAVFERGTTKIGGYFGDSSKEMKIAGTGIIRFRPGPNGEMIRVPLSFIKAPVAIDLGGSLA